MHGVMFIGTVSKVGPPVAGAATAVVEFINKRAPLIATRPCQPLQLAVPLNMVIYYWEL